MNREIQQQSAQTKCMNCKLKRTQTTKNHKQFDVHSCIYNWSSQPTIQPTHNCSQNHFLQIVFETANWERKPSSYFHFEPISSRSNTLFHMLVRAFDAYLWHTNRCGGGGGEYILKTRKNCLIHFIHDIFLHLFCCFFLSFSFRTFRWMDGCIVCSENEEDHIQNVLPTNIKIKFESKRMNKIAAKHMQNTHTNVRARAHTLIQRWIDISV